MKKSLYLFLIVKKQTNNHYFYILQGPKTSKRVYNANFEFRKQRKNYETLTSSFVHSQVSYLLKNSSQSDAENEFPK